MTVVICTYRLGFTLMGLIAMSSVQYTAMVGRSLPTSCTEGTNQLKGISLIQLPNTGGSGRIVDKLLVNKGSTATAASHHTDEPRKIADGFPLPQKVSQLPDFPSLVVLEVNAVSLFRTLKSRLDGMRQRVPVECRDIQCIVPVALVFGVLLSCIVLVILVMLHVRDVDNRSARLGAQTNVGDNPFLFVGGKAVVRDMESQAGKQLNGRTVTLERALGSSWIVRVDGESIPNTRCIRTENLVPYDPFVGQPNEKQLLDAANDH